MLDSARLKPSPCRSRSSHTKQQDRIAKIQSVINDMEALALFTSSERHELLCALFAPPIAPNMMAQTDEQHAPTAAAVQTIPRKSHQRASRFRRGNGSRTNKQRRGQVVGRERARIALNEPAAGARQNG
jgi:hypothetical protein